MCLIIAKPKGIDLPLSEYIYNGTDVNKDGIGVAFCKNGSNEILIKKDFLTTIEFINWLNQNATREDSLIIHFRLATSGLKDEGNRHPFPITKNWKMLRDTNLLCQSAVAHNGIISEYIKGEKYSDTQKFVMDILSDESVKNNLTSPSIQKLIKSFLKNDKLAILLSNGELILLGDFNVDKGISYSNFSYRYTKTTCDNYYNHLPNHYGKTWSWCEGCKKTLENVIDLNFKKVKLSLCKLCRKKLTSGGLENLIKEKKNRSNSYTNTTIKCIECQCYVNYLKANYVDVGRFICDDCKKIKDEKNKENEESTCDACDKKFLLKEMREFESSLVCLPCYDELNGLQANDQQLSLPFKEENKNESNDIQTT